MQRGNDGLAMNGVQRTARPTRLALATEAQSPRSDSWSVTGRGAHSKDEARLDPTARGHKVKVGVALRLRAETTVNHGWIAERLERGSGAGVSTLLYHRPRNGEQK